MLANTYIRSTGYKIHKCSRTFWGRNFEWKKRSEKYKIKKYFSIIKDRISSHHERIKIFLEMEEKIM